MRFKIALASAAAVLLPAVASAQPVSLDGQIGAEWTGIGSVSVGYDPAAPMHNFGAPGNTNHATAYEIFMRRDDSYLYTAFRTTDGGSASGLMFANLYFHLRSGAGPYGSSGASIGFEVSNDRAFRPGVPGYYNDNADNLIQFATTSGSGNPDVLEAAISLSAFLGNSLGVVGFVPPADPVGIRLNLSQTFGYSVAGGESYGDSRLGFVELPSSAVPEPSTYALMAAGLVALGMVARRRRTT